MARYPRLLHAEWGGDSHAGRFRQPPHIHEEPLSTVDNAEEVGTATSEDGFTRYSKDGDWSESYIVNLMDHHLMIQNKLENFAGSLQWAFKDFGTPLRPENPVPYVNQKGLLARDGTPKLNYAVFQGWNLKQASNVDLPDAEDSVLVCTDFTVSLSNDRIQVTLLDKNGNVAIRDDRRVRFYLMAGGNLIRYCGHMGGSDVIETASGCAWLRVIPDDNAQKMTIGVEVDGVGVKQETLTIERT